MASKAAPIRPSPLRTSSPAFGVGVALGVAVTDDVPFAVTISVAPPLEVGSVDDVPLAVTVSVAPLEVGSVDGF